MLSITTSELAGERETRRQRQRLERYNLFTSNRERGGMSESTASTVVTLKKEGRVNWRVLLIFVFLIGKIMLIYSDSRRRQLCQNHFGLTNIFKC